MVLSTFDNVIFEKIISKILEKKCEIDPLSMRYETIKLLLGYLEKNNMDQYGKLRDYLERYFKEEIMEHYEDYIDNKIYVLNETLLMMEEVKDMYKFNGGDFEKGNFSVVYNYYNTYYRKEEILKYLYLNVGQEKLDSKRRISEYKSRQMKEMLKDKREKGERGKAERKQKIYDLLWDAGLFITNGLYEVDYYVENGGELDDKLITKILKKAERMIKKEREQEVRRENLKEQLERYDCWDKKKDRMCVNYINGVGEYSLKDVVNYVRDMKWLEINTEYKIMLRNGVQIEKYDSLLGKYVVTREFDNIFNNYGDMIKTYAVEKLLVNKGWDRELLGDVPPLIRKRIDEAIRKRERNDYLVGEIERERELKREELRERELEKKRKRREEAKLRREQDKKGNDKKVVVKEA